LNRKSQQLSYKHRVRSELRQVVLSYLAINPCVTCGETDPLVLEFDHIDQINKIDSISRMINDCRSLKEILAEIDKCQVLCANCHRRRTHMQLGYWKYLKST
jgi:hypothetical protein